MASHLDILAVLVLYGEQGGFLHLASPEILFSLWRHPDNRALWNFPNLLQATGWFVCVEGLRLWRTGSSLLESPCKVLQIKKSLFSRAEISLMLRKRSWDGSHALSLAEQCCRVQRTRSR